MMIKPNELRIDNWVKWPDEKEPNEVKWQHGHWLGVFEGNYSFPEQIPLTEEWLIKFAIKIDHDISDVFCIEINNSLRTTVYILKVKNGWSIEIGSRSNGMVSFRSEIQYVHQLQNLYFALTGNELTINA